VIEQAIYGSQDGGGYRFLARSPGFGEDWLAEAERVCTGFGERPAGAACPAALFARPFGARQVIVVQVADQGTDDAGRPGALGFRLLVLSRQLYEDLGGDPFFIADQLPPPWDARGELPALEWPGGPPPRRTVEDVQKVLNVPYSATLLGGVQALMDGARVVFERTAPEPHLLRSLWALLPGSTRSGLWPATYAFSNAHGFDALVVPRASGPEYAQYVFEEQAGDYPEGRYELAVQIAAEAGNQSDLDALFSRRSRAQVFRLGLALLAVFVFVPLAASLLLPPRAPEVPVPADDGRPRLPPVDACPSLDAPERAALAGRLHRLGDRLGVALPQGTSDAALTDALEALDARLGTPNPRRDPGRLRDLGPLQRQVRALLWKHDVADYNLVALNTDELIERLDEKLGQVPGKGVP
jgi:hypothetical protein